MASRFRFIEAAYAILVVAGGVTALAANRLELEWLKNADILAVVVGIVVFGVDMVVHRRADVGRAYSSSISPSKPLRSSALAAKGATVGWLESLVK